MPQLLLEIFSEEIPARMQAQAAKDLDRMVRERLATQGLLPEALAAFAGPRRLTLVAEGLAAAQGDRTEERKGPRIGAPDQAIDGFLRSTGLGKSDLIARDGTYFAQIKRNGRPTPEIIAEIVDEVIRGFPWPKSMTWGEGCSTAKSCRSTSTASRAGRPPRATASWARAGRSAPGLSKPTRTAS
jgi:glycyl-tRNA synthetase beta chain